jgi:hypothetical protein
MKKTPKIDERDFERIVAELRALAPYCVPELDVSGDKGEGVALIKIFANMLTLVIGRLNRVPDKNFIAFLDMLSIKLLPALSARAPVTFYLSGGATETVLIPEKAQIAAGEIVFETERNILAAPSRLVKAYSISVEKDGIYESPPNVVSGEPVAPFQTKLLYGANTGAKEIFLSSTEGLQKGDVLNIELIEYGIVSEISDSRVILSHKLGKNLGAGSIVEKETSFELFEGKNLQEHILYLGHTDLFNVKSNVTFELTISPGNSKIADDQLVSWQYWGESEGTKILDWYDFNPIPGGTDNKVVLTKGDNNEIKEREINGIESRWIRCLVNASKISNLRDVEIDTIKVAVTPLAETNMLPDMAFYNDIPLDLTLDGSQNFRWPIYPFGKIPRLYDTFFIASHEAFSKIGAGITLDLHVDMDSGGNPTPNPLLSWEYWDGKGWVRISSVGNNFESGDHPINIEDFPTLEPTKVNGQENFWIRVRLVGGHYGLEVKIIRNRVWAGKVTPPKITKLSINYNYEEETQNIEHILTHNNLEFINVTKECKSENKSFKPFKPLDDDHQTLYLGFDNKLEKAPISIFFAIEEQPWSVDKISSIEWEYYAGGGKWVRLEVLDETRGLLRSGAIEFVFPRDFKNTKKFGEELHWIRAVDVKDGFKPIMSICAQLPPAYLIQLITAMPALSRFIRPEYPITAISHSELTHLDSSAEIEGENQCDESISELEPCPALLEAFQPEWHHIEEVKEEILSPKIKGIFLNTTWAVQAETVKEELLGSSDGTAGQSFILSKTPIITEGIWVNEIGTITEEERSNIIEKAEFEVRETKEEEGKVTEFLVKWKPVEDFLASSKDDRHYELDRVSGEVKFGDGIYGKIPPIGRDNITVDYRSGGGSKGNVIVDEIKDLKSSIAYVDKASNPLSAGGGTDVEDIDECIERGPLVLKHRNRAVTASDFEQITLQASRAIGRAKCLPNFDNQGHFKPGRVTVIVIPESGEDKPKLSLQLKRQVETYLREHSANTLQLQVSEPVYAEASVTTILTATSIDAIPIVEKEAFIMLREFLHPLTGGYGGNGWEFGRMPCLSDFYALLEKIDGVDYVKELSVDLRTYDADDKIISEILISPERPVDIEIPPYAIVYSGEHEITVNIEKTAGGK